MLMAITKNTATAEELTQEVFFLAFRKKVRPGPGMRLWLREVARRLAANELRRRRPVLIDPSSIEHAARNVPAPEGAAHHSTFNEEVTALRRCMKKLSEEDRQVLAARYQDNTPLADIAGQVNQSAGYIKQRLFRLRKRLGECIQRGLGRGGTSDA